MSVIRSAFPLVQFLHVDLLSAAVHFLVVRPTPLFLRAPLVVVVLKVSVAGTVLHLAQNHHLAVIHVL